MTKAWGLVAVIVLCSVLGSGVRAEEVALEILMNPSFEQASDPEKLCDAWGATGWEGELDLKLDALVWSGKALSACDPLDEEDIAVQDGKISLSLGPYKFQMVETTAR